jgi:hypothetical protein
MNKKRLIIQAVTIWLITNAIASALYTLHMFATGSLKPLTGIASSDTLIAVVVLGLIFSFPATLFLMPGLYMLSMFRHTRTKMAYAFGIVLFLCLCVILVFFMFFDVPNRDKPEIVIFLLPYIIAAEVSFFFVAWKLIVRNPTETTYASGGHSQKI